MQPVRFPVEGVDYSGTCKASVTSTSVSCYCEFEIGGLKVSGFDSACLTISKKTNYVYTSSHISNHALFFRHGLCSKGLFVCDGKSY